MGSLPNLHELERVRRTLIPEYPDGGGGSASHRDHQLRTREYRETSCDRETLPIFLHSQIPLHPQLLSHTFTATATISTVAAAASGQSASVGTPGQMARHHHRHSLTTRRVLRTRSSGASYNIWDDPMIEHMAAYSPISTRSHRISVLPSYQTQHALSSNRRRDSINSSIGANSIRRLLTINSRQCRHKVPSNVRTKVCKNFTLLAIGHGMLCAILVPLVGLQGSNSIWHHREQWVNVGPNVGAMLLSISFLISSGMCFLTTRLIRKLGHTFLIASSYTGICFFLACHLVPSIYTLIPAYVILGVTLGPAWVSKLALIVFYANKLSCTQHECNTSSAGAGAGDSSDDHKVSCNRDQKVRRLARLYHAAQDLGIIFGSAIAAIVLSCASMEANCLTGKIPLPLSIELLQNNVTHATTLSGIIMPSHRNITAVSRLPSGWTLTTQHPSPDELDELYNHNEHGERICGADLCPVWNSPKELNGSSYAHFVQNVRGYGDIALILIYLSMAAVSVGLACFTGRGEKSFRIERTRGMSDTLIFAGPMAYFIGTEQGYMLGDFTRAYVSCSLGIPMVAGALVGMGIMQAIVSCTLSMLLRHTKRLIVLAAGFFFHACLLLVLSRWKPSSDDSALFYVIAAGWGACNAMWETLLFALITLTHTNHVAEIVSPLQGLRFLGLGITFAAHGFLCENPKILILVIVLVLSVPPYAMLEIRLESQRKAHAMSL